MPEAFRLADLAPSRPFVRRRIKCVGFPKGSCNWSTAYPFWWVNTDFTEIGPFCFDCEQDWVAAGMPEPVRRTRRKRPAPASGLEEALQLALGQSL